MEARKIIHIDMDAFYASVEQRDHPELRGKPIAVGGHRERGVVAAASYEAREYGVRSAMSAKVATRKCPQLIFLPVRMQHYKAVSAQLFEIFKRYTDLIEPLSLDEAFLDVTVNKLGQTLATDLALELKAAIQSELQLTASAGVSYCKFLAKVASDMDKPNGIYVIKPHQAQGFIDNLPIEKFFGVGLVTAQKMHAMGITKGADIKKFTLLELTERFGKAGVFFHRIARGIDDRPVRPNRKRKSVGAEKTFDTDIPQGKEITERLEQLAYLLLERINSANFEGRTLSLKVRFDDFEQLTRSKTFVGKLGQFHTIWDETLQLFQSIDLAHRKIRLLGITVSNSEDELIKGMPIQLKLPFRKYD